MINFFSILLFYLAISFTQIIPSYEYSDWNVLQDQDIWIGWTNYKDFDWGKARITFDYSSDQVSSVLDDHGNYTNIFKRMTKKLYTIFTFISFIFALPLQVGDVVPDFSVPICV